VVQAYKKDFIIALTTNERPANIKELLKKRDLFKV
jgi:hypothetical protein